MDVIVSHIPFMAGNMPEADLSVTPWLREDTVSVLALRCSQERFHRVSFVGSLLRFCATVSVIDHTF